MLKGKLIIGLTGGIATGKSSVAAILKKMGIVVIDADQVAREIVEPGKPAWREIIGHFGTCILNEDQTIDRGALGKIIFQDANARKALNEITHPKIRAEIFQQLDEALLVNDLVVLEIPLLIESGSVYPVDEIWVVYTEPETQKSRLMQRNKLTAEEAENRILAQMSMEEKIKKAHRVINNSGTLKDLEEEVRRLVHAVEGNLRNQNEPVIEGENSHGEDSK